MVKYLIFIFIVFLIFTYSIVSFLSLCLNENNNPLDWFLVYKLPKEQVKYQSSGLNYVFITSEDNDNTNRGWKLSNKLIVHQSSIIAATLYYIYNQSVNYILYSDQPPTNEKGENYGHTKGILAFDDHEGFWLMHSVPKFPPPISKGYDYPISGRYNGQLMFCVSFLVKEQLENIAIQLLYNKIKIYDHNISSHIINTYPVLSKILAKDWFKNGSNWQNIYSIAGQKFTVFSKTSKPEIDLYSDFIAETLKTDLLAETWRIGSGNPLPSACHREYSVQNIVSLKLEINGTFLIWNYTEDHSKWAISLSFDNPVACIGDINRMKSQFKRAGGSLCIHNPNIWRNFYNLIKAIEPCPKNRNMPPQEDNYGLQVFKNLIHWIEDILFL